MSKNVLIDKTVLNRRKKLRAWIDANCGGAQVDFITQCANRAYEISQGELSGLLRAKSFGEKKARAIERGAGMPTGYLDSPVDDAQIYAVSVWPFEGIKENEYQLLDAEQRADIEKYIKLQIASQAASDGAKKNQNQISPTISTGPLAKLPITSPTPLITPLIQAF